MTFPEGNSSAPILLRIVHDNVAELNEVTRVTLTTVLQNGVPASGDASRGARIVPGLDQAVITVQANDDPHGVVSWSSPRVLAREEEGSDSVVELSLLREFGDIAAIVVSYTTVVDMSVPEEERAESLQDFIPSSGDVVIGNGETSTNITITIRQVRT